MTGRKAAQSPPDQFKSWFKSVHIWLFQAAASHTVHEKGDDEGWESGRQSVYLARRKGAWFPSTHHSPFLLFNMDWTSSLSYRCLVDHLIHCGLLVTRAGDNVLVICWDVTAQDWRGFLWLEEEREINKRKLIRGIKRASLLRSNCQNIYVLLCTDTAFSLTQLITQSTKKKGAVYISTSSHTVTPH